MFAEFRGRAPVRPPLNTPLDQPLSEVVFTARCICISARYMLSPGVRLSVCLSRSGVAPKRIKISSKFFSPSGSDTILVFPYQRGTDIPTGTPLTGASNRRGMKNCRRNRGDIIVTYKLLSGLYDEQVTLQHRWLLYTCATVS